MNRYKKLANNIFVFLIGNAGTKLLLFFLVSICTYYFSNEEYGVYDIITQIINLMLPFSMFGVSEAVLRFILDKTENNIKILSNILAIVFFGIFFTWLLSPLFSFYSVVGKYYILIPLSISFQSLYTIFHQYTKGTGKNWVFVFSDLIEAAVQLGLSFFLLNVMQDKVYACIIALVIGYGFALIFIVLKINVYTLFKKENIDKQLIRRLVIYSIPLMPNSILWWVTDMSNRFIVEKYTGLAAVGLYSIASKIPSLISTFTNVVFQAWQISAVEEYDSKDKSSFFSIVMDLCITLIFILVAGISVFVKPITSILVSDDFFSAWIYIPLLLIATIFSSIQSFIGTNYMASKNTLGALSTTALGAISNIAMNFLLIPRYGVIGAIIATVISYVIITVARYVGTYKYVAIRFNWKLIVINAILITLILYRIYTTKLMIDPFSVLIFIILLLFDGNNLIKLLGHAKAN